MDVEVQSYLISHLGIVAGIFDSLNIAEVIDRSLPKKSYRNLSHSVVIKAMILNGLGFTHQRLYLFPNFFKTIPTEKLLGVGISPSDLNDDIVGRTLTANLAMTSGNDPRYAFYVTDLNYGGMPQRAVVVWSEEPPDIALRRKG